MTVDESMGTDGDDAVLAELYANVESMAHEATRATELAQGLRTALEDARRELDALRVEHEQRQRSIEEEVARQRSDGEARVAAVRLQLDSAQSDLESTRTTHDTLEAEITRLEETRNEVRDELADLQSRLFGMLPAIDRVQSAQRELAAALVPESDDESDSDELLPSRPIGRLMDAHSEDGGEA